MKTEAIRYQSERIDLCVVLRAATISDGIRFSIWQNEAIENHHDGDPTAGYIRTVLHPVMCAALDVDESHIILDGIPLSLPPAYDDFSRLPEIPLEIINQWYQAARAINPQWEPQGNSEKKESVTTSINASPGSISRRGRKGKRSNSQT